MNFTVEWTAEALAQLAATWSASDDRDGVTVASYRIESQLRVRPSEVGESRDGDDRILFDPPLVVIFRAVPDQQIVFVISVGPSRPRR